MNWNSLLLKTYLIMQQEKDQNGKCNPNRSIVVTGYGPFGDHKINASWEAVKLLKNLFFSYKRESAYHIIEHLMVPIYRNSCCQLFINFTLNIRCNIPYFCISFRKIMIRLPINLTFVWGESRLLVLSWNSKADCLLDTLLCTVFVIQ